MPATLSQALARFQSDPTQVQDGAVQLADVDTALLAWLAGGSAVLAILGALAAPWLIVRVPADFLMRERQAPRGAPLPRLLWWLLRNTLGAVLLLAGLAMLVLPGQGILTILVALSLMDLPRKRAVLRALIRRTGADKPINRLRERAGKPPLRVDPG